MTTTTSTTSPATNAVVALTAVAAAAAAALLSISQPRRLHRLLQKDDVPPEVLARLAREKSKGVGTSSLLDDFRKGGYSWAHIVATEVHREETLKRTKEKGIWKPRCMGEPPH